MINKKIIKEMERGHVGGVLLQYGGALSVYGTAWGEGEGGLLMILHHNITSVTSFI